MRHRLLRPRAKLAHRTAGSVLHCRSFSRQLHYVYRYVLNRYLGTYPSLSADVALGSGECQDSVTHQNKEVVCYVADSLVVRWLTYNNISWYLINLQLCLQRSQLRLPLQSLPVPAAASIGSVHRVLIDRYSNGSWPADYRTLSVLCPSAGCV